MQTFRQSISPATQNIRSEWLKINAPIFFGINVVRESPIAIHITTLRQRFKVLPKTVALSLTLAPNPRVRLSSKHLFSDRSY